MTLHEWLQRPLCSAELVLHVPAVGVVPSVRELQKQLGRLVQLMLDSTRCVCTVRTCTCSHAACSHVVRWMDGTCLEVPCAGGAHPWSMYHDVSRHQRVVRAVLAVQATAQHALQEVHK